MSENEKFIKEAAKKSLELLIQFDDLEFSKMVLSKTNRPFARDPLYLIDGSIEELEVWRVDSAFVCVDYTAVGN